MKQGTQRWCTGMTQKDGMGREGGGTSVAGDTCIPGADSCQWMAKTTDFPVAQTVKNLPVM